MRGVRYWTTSIVVACATVGSAPQIVAQQDTTSLEARVNELDQQVRILQRLRELSADSAAAAAKDKVSATASSKDGFSIKSADGKYAVRLRGLLQADGRFFLNDSAFPVVNTFLIRRARPILEATVGKYLEFRVQPDFGQGTTVLFDAYTDVKVAPEFAIRAGKFKPAVDLERYQSASDIVFAERALATNLAPNRDLGLQLSGDIGTGTLTWQAGVFNGVPDLGNGDVDVSDAKDFAGRVFVQPFKTGSLSGLGVGVAGTTGLERGTPTAPALVAGYRTPGQQTWFRYINSTTTPANNVFADGRRARLAPQAYWYTGPLGIHAEYIQSWQTVSKIGAPTTKLKHTAWQATGSFFVTGEKNSFKSATPKKPFDPKAGTFGALELAARYSQLSIDDATFPTFASASTPSEAKAWAVGLNWYLARAIKIVVDYEHTTFTGGAATGDREPENFVVTRVQHSF